MIIKMNQKETCNIMIFLICFCIITSAFCVKFYMRYLGEENKRRTEKVLNESIDLFYESQIEILKSENRIQSEILHLILGDYDEDFTSNEEIFKLIQYIKEYKHNKLPEPLIPIIAKAIIENSKKYNFTTAEVVALIQGESNFLPWAKSKANAIGLTQIMPTFWKLDSTSDYYDIDTNINKGLKILRSYIELYGYEKGLSTYNMGPDNTQKGKINWDYVKTFKLNAKAYKKYEVKDTI